MSIKSYGFSHINIVSSSLEKNLEELKISGYTIIENVLSENHLEIARSKIDEIYDQIENEEGKDALESINERYMIRCPLYFDDFFMNIAANKKILDIVEKVIGNYYILHLQNAIINPPDETHHQSSWHRDLPYQNFVISKPLALSALYCIDEFSELTGGTMVLPHTHNFETIPSVQYIESHKVSVIAKAGSVILFDSMLLHKAGYNRSDKFRRAINNIYTVPIIKQQLNIPNMLKNKYQNNDFLLKFLGYHSQVPNSDAEWRTQRKKKLEQRK